MNSLLKSFLAIISDLKALEKSYTENLTIFTIEYNIHVDELHSFLHKNEDILSDDRISIDIKLEERSIGKEEFLDIYAHLDKIHVEIKVMINKKESFNLSSNTVLFFKIDSLYKYFNAFSTELFNSFDHRVILDLIVPVSTTIKNQYIKLSPIDEFEIPEQSNVMIEDLDEYDRITKIRREISGGFSNNIPIPNYFIFDNLPSSLSAWNNLNLLNSGLIHLANQHNQDKLTIRGYKNSEIIFEQHESPNSRIMFQIFKFSYEEKHQTDKLEISRNIFTIYLESSNSTRNVDSLLPKIHETILSHFTAYMHDSIKKFFNDRKDVIKEAHKYASDLKSETDKLLTYINTSLLGIITAIFSGSIGFSKGDKGFLVIAFSLHAVLFLTSYLLNRGFVKSRADEIVSLYEKYIEKFVLLANDDLTFIREVYIDPARKNVDKYLKRYKIVIIVLIVIMLVLVAIVLALPAKILSALSTVSNNIFDIFK